MNYKVYNEYKKSNSDWIGLIPVNWNITRLKFLVNIITGSTPSKNDDTYYKNGIFPWVKPDDLNGLIPITSTNVLINNEGKRVSRIIPKDSILVCCIGSLGKIGIAGTELATNQQINSLIPNNLLNNDFCKYMIVASSSEYEKYANSNVVAIINKQQQGELIYPVPSLDEQKQIANYLDKKTSNIGETIAKNEKLIQLLEEKRVALINQVVTKGLNPDVPMKDSGIEWIGEIPEHWETNKIKNMSYVKGRIGWHGLTSEEYSDEGAYLVTGTDFANGTVEWNNCNHINYERYKQDPNIHLKEGDLLITKDGTIGKLALIKNIPDKATLNSGIFLVRPLKDNYTNDYLYWILSSDIFTRFFDYIKTGATIAHLYQETFERFFFPYMSLNEQEQIVNYLNENVSKIDLIIKKVEGAIKLLEEYKTSLINHVVTGKVDVRGEEI